MISQQYHYRLYLLPHGSDDWSREKFADLKAAQRVAGLARRCPDIAQVQLYKASEDGLSYLTLDVPPYEPTPEDDGHVFCREFRIEPQTGHLIPMRTISFRYEPPVLH